MRETAGAGDRPRLKVKFADFWQEYVPEKGSIFPLLAEKYEVEFSDQPDLVFCCHFGDAHWKYSNSVKAFCKSEVILDIPEGRFDYVIGYVDREDQRHIYWSGTPNLRQVEEKREKALSKGGRRKFCNFIYSQDTTGEGAALRKEFCRELNRYKRVDCPGRVLNNMTSPLSARENDDWHESKLDFVSDYRFTISFENTQLPGYHTEKIWDPLAAGSVPIYWGDPRLLEETGLNPEALIDCTPLGTDIQAMVRRVIELDGNEEAYQRMLDQPLFIGPGADHTEKLRACLWEIAEETLRRKEQRASPFCLSERSVRETARYGYNRTRKRLGKIKRRIKRLLGWQIEEETPGDGKAR